ncbi:MAG: DUF4340 domain-containing protein [Chloroflexi bacterium]|nr:DUF4340 domain-containing protein [Chloroflexota bacterium]
MRPKHLAIIIGLASLLLAVGLFIGFRQRSDAPDVLSPSLTPLTRLSPEEVDRITLRLAEREVALVKDGAGWRVGDHPAFAAKMDVLWTFLRRLDAAPTVAENAETHPSLGVSADNALTVTFWRNGTLVDQLLVGVWLPDSQFTSIRRPPSDEVAAVSADLRTFLDPAVDTWRERTIVDIANVNVGALRFSLPEEKFTLRLVTPPREDPGAPKAPLAARYGAGSASAGLPGLPGQASSLEGTPTATPTGQEYGWVIETGAGRKLAADQDLVFLLLQRLAPLLATGFADDERERLSAAQPAWSLEIVRTVFGALALLDFYPKDDQTYYVRKAGSRDVFLVDAATVNGLGNRLSDLKAAEPSASEE